MNTNKTFPNTKVSKRFKKKIKNFRQGMSAWRVYGYPIKDHNYRDWGSNREELDRKYGQGNAMCFRANGSWYFIYCERKCNVPMKTVWGWIDWHGGKRKLSQFKSLRSMMGSYGDRFFSSAQQARAFMQEIIDGLHPSIVNESYEYHSELDELDDHYAITMDYDYCEDYDD